ncbi:hypothetical protein J6V85_03900 [Candidatus Saccharibacteria bacterium]|nr:hypothetical protein [Candidatus Saccharibacteria bacterium]
MKNFKNDIVKIYQTERGMLVLMIINFLLAAGLFIYSILNMNPDVSVVRVGYGDIDGYRDGSWIDILAFPVLAVIFGILHNLLAVKIFHKRSGGMAKFFLLLTSALILGAILVFARILGEG